MPEVPNNPTHWHIVEIDPESILQVHTVCTGTMEEVENYMLNLLHENPNLVVKDSTIMRHDPLAMWAVSWSWRS